MDECCVLCQSRQEREREREASVYREEERHWHHYRESVKATAAGTSGPKALASMSAAGDVLSICPGSLGLCCVYPHVALAFRSCFRDVADGRWSFCAEDDMWPWPIPVALLPLLGPSVCTSQCHESQGGVI